MGYHHHARGAVYSDPVSVVGGIEGVAQEEDGERGYHGSGERSLWECGRGRSCRGDDATGRFEDEADVGEGERAGWSVAGENFEGVRAKGFLFRHGPQSAVDQCWRCCLLR